MLTISSNYHHINFKVVMEKKGFHIFRKSAANVHSKVFEWADAIEDMGQVWTKGSYDKEKCVRDQYQFMIVTRDTGGYDLYRAEEYIITMHTLNGAKFVSLIMLNEKILKS
jgi:hypothetical protein